MSRQAEVTKVEQRVDGIMRLRRAGWSVDRIAEEYEVSAEVVHHCIETRLKQDASLMSATDRQSAITLELQRLDDLQRAHWEAAMLGDPKSSEIVLKIMAERAKRLQMDAVDPETHRQQVLVIGGAEAEYIKGLMEADK